MDKKKFESYEETHKKLAEALQEACSTKEFGQYEIPDMDLSFLEDDSDLHDRGDFLVPEIAEKKKRVHFSRFTKVTAVVIIALLSINVFMLATESTDSYGQRGLLHRIYKSVTGIITDEGQEMDSTDVLESFESLNLKDAKTFFPSLYIPEYIPAGFNLESLIIERYTADDYWVQYIYTNTEESIYIDLSYYQNSRFKYYSEGEGNMIEMDDRILYSYISTSTNEYTVEVYFEDCMMNIEGINDENELTKIAENMQN